MSATMPSYAIERTESFMRHPFKLLVKSDQLTLDGIRQFYINVGNEAHKLATMDELYPFLNSASGIAFCNTRKRTEWLNDKMQVRGHKISDMVRFTEK
jgi:superfamily II DNA/RNA helicase